jgi:hypothetical protein
MYNALLGTTGDRDHTNVEASHLTARANEMFYPRSCWYDISGRVLGCGNLEMQDVSRLRGTLAEKEIIVVVSAACRASQGIDEVLGWCPFLITKDKIYFVSNSKDVLKNPYPHGSIEASVLDVAEAKEFLAQGI